MHTCTPVQFPADNITETLIKRLTDPRVEFFKWKIIIYHYYSLSFILMAVTLALLHSPADGTHVYRPLSIVC